MPSDPLVSVIIPCYNQAQYLPDALQSVLDQSYTNWECIIVNDGSPDNTEEIVQQWITKDARFKYVFKQNGGLAEARNNGIRASTGKYILPLDSDDKISKEYLEKAVLILENSPAIGVVYCEAEYFGDKKGKWKLPPFSTDELLRRNIVFCSALFRRSDFERTSGYDNKLIYGWEDWDLWLSFIELGCEFYKIPETHFFYRVKKESMITSLDEIKKKYLYRLIFLNHMDLYFENIGEPQAAYFESRKLVRSKEYRLGKLIISPLRKIKKILNR